ncbi:MAG TPA: hypothetical protein VLG49_08410 [Rhabdochlamydiaceae bacterium]|nr:hypothetical protein [Rhabdochlamydiaceae bacterium]
MGEQCFARTPDEDAIWRSEMSLKGASRGHGHEVLCPRHVSRGPLQLIPIPHPMFCQYYCYIFKDLLELHGLF